MWPHTGLHRSKFCAPTLVKFAMAWISMFSNSQRVGVMWRTQTRTCNISYSELGSEVDGGL